MACLRSWKITWERAKGSFVAMRELIKRHFFHKTLNQCEIKSLVLNVIRYGCDSTGSGKLSREKLSWIGEKTEKNFRELVKKQRKTFVDWSLLPCQRTPSPRIWQWKLSWIATKLWKSFLPQKISTIWYTVPSRSHQREWWGLSPHSFESPTQTVLPNPWEGRQ